MHLKPYMEFAKGKEDREKGIIMEFKNGISAAVVDLYCVNPDCSCVEVMLDFIEVDKNKRFKKKIFAFGLNTQTWEMGRTCIENKVLNCEEMISEFMAGLDESIKEMLRRRVAAAKEYGKENPLEWFDELGPADGSCFGYSEIFGERDVDKFLFDYKGVAYLVDDQYCTNPDCKCNEVVLTFFDLIPGKKAQEPRFAIRMPFGAGRYKVEFSNKTGEDEIKAIVDRFKERQREDPGILKRRYAQMKEFGRKRLERQRQNTSNSQLIKRSKIGRNEPCPCGSGKKYKKCCGP